MEDWAPDKEDSITTEAGQPAKTAKSGWRVYHRPSSAVAGVSHDSPRAQMCTFQGPALQSRERKKEENCGGKREKKARNFGPTLRGPTFSRFGASTLWAPPFGPPTLRAPHPSGLHPSGPHFFQVWASTLRAPTLRAPHPGSPPFGAHPSKGPHTLSSQNSTSKNWPKSKLAEVEIGRSRNWPKSITPECAPHRRSHGAEKRPNQMTRRSRQPAPRKPRELSCRGPNPPPSKDTAQEAKSVVVANRA